MLKKFVGQLSRKPIVFNFLRKIIEINFIAIKKTIRNELLLNIEHPNSSQKKILDVPCGTGEFCTLFNPYSYIGIDISQEYINYAKKKYNHIFFCKDARKNGFDDHFFDNVLMLGLFHHLDMPDTINILKETKRVLKKDGKILIIEDAPVTSKWNIIGKFLQRYDVGSNIRPIHKYREALEDYFNIDKCYSIQNGVWNYSVFIVSHK